MPRLGLFIPDRTLETKAAAGSHPWLTGPPEHVWIVWRREPRFAIV
jgi:hypothetical protein